MEVNRTYLMVKDQRLNFIFSRVTTQTEAQRNLGPGQPIVLLLVTIITLYVVDSLAGYTVAGAQRYHMRTILPSFYGYFPYDPIFNTTLD